jgi:polyphosphate kinase
MLPAPSATPSFVRPVALDDPSLYKNRELSWLEFNQRVLDQALDDYHPLLERVKFLAIVSSNLDEFFMVRVATLLKKQRAGIEQISIDGQTVVAQLAAIRRRAAVMMKDVSACWSERLRPALEEHGIRFLELDEYTPKITRYLASYFRAEIFPLLTPLAFDPGHPFPVVSTLSKNFAVVVRQGRRNKFARVKIPPLLPRFIPLAGAPTAPGVSGATFAFLEDVVRANLGQLFPGIELADAHLFRVIRDTDMEVPEYSADDLLESVDRTLRELRHAPPSLLQVESAMPARVVNTLIENFEVEEDIVVRTAERLDVSDWMALHKLPYAHLKDVPFTPRTLWNVHRHPCVFDDIREQDHLVHHPFDSFGAVEAFLKQAAADSNVVGIKMTLYRVGANSPLIDRLIEASASGKQVAVLVELKARFDERNNIQWATRLEDAGVHVVYGVEGLKTHCKLCMVVRKEADGIRRYVHIGTGNYNRATSQVYTDFGLFTADPGVLDDVAEVFNFLTGYSRQAAYDHLIVAPVNLRKRFAELVAREIAHARARRRAHMIVKVNAVTDVKVVRTLYGASQAGVDIDMIVRGACALRPGVRGVSERIRVRSIVGRFLEHSRAYYFENGGEPELYIGSADLMERNLDRRVETLCRVRDASITRHIRDVVLDAYLRDTDRAYVLVNGEYQKAAPSEDGSRLSAQQLLLDWYRSNPIVDEDSPRSCEP